MVKKLASHVGRSGKHFAQGRYASEDSWVWPRGLRFTTLLIVDLLVVTVALLGAVNLGHERLPFPQNALELAAGLGCCYCLQ